MEQEKKQNLKISKTIMIIGIVMLVVAIVLLILSINKANADYTIAEQKYNEQVAEYNAAYDDWYHRWWDLHTASPNEMPTKTDYVDDVLGPRYNPTFIILSGFGILISFGVIFAGMRPYFLKFVLKRHKEVLDYTGEDISNVGTKIVDIAKPVVNKATDDIVAPIVSKVVSATKSAKEGKVEADNNNSVITCPKCKDKVDSDEMFCSNCGFRLKIECPKCQKINSYKDKFCKKCGNKL